MHGPHIPRYTCPCRMISPRSPGCSTVPAGKNSASLAEHSPMSSQAPRTVGVAAWGERDSAQGSCA